jgi:hypothetical protein
VGVGDGVGVVDAEYTQIWLMFGKLPPGFWSKLTLYGLPSEIVTIPLLLLPAFTHTWAVPPVAEIVVPPQVIVTPLKTVVPEAVSNFVPPAVGQSLLLPPAKAVGADAATAASITASKTRSRFIPSPLHSIVWPSFPAAFPHETAA